MRHTFSSFPTAFRKNIKWLFAVYLISLSQSCYSQSSIEKIKFVSKSDTLVGYLNKPKSVANFSVVVVTHLASLGNHDSPIETIILNVQWWTKGKFL